MSSRSLFTSLTQSSPSSDWLLYLQAAGKDYWLSSDEHSGSLFYCSRERPQAQR